MQPGPPTAVTNAGRYWGFYAGAAAMGLTILDPLASPTAKAAFEEKFKCKAGAGVAASGRRRWLACTDRGPKVCSRGVQPAQMRAMLKTQVCPFCSLCPFRLQLWKQP